MRNGSRPDGETVPPELLWPYGSECGGNTAIMRAVSVLGFDYVSEHSGGIGIDTAYVKICDKDNRRGVYVSVCVGYLQGRGESSIAEKLSLAERW